MGQSLFPVGDLEKPRCAASPSSLDLVAAKKKTPPVFCFIGERKFSDFLAKFLPAPARPHRNRGRQGDRHAPGLMYHTLEPAQGARHTAVATPPKKPGAWSTKRSSATRQW